MFDKKQLKPVRTDVFFMKDVLQAAFNARIGMILFAVIVLILVVVIIVLMSQPPLTVVIDGSTGRTYYPIERNRSREVAQELIDRQLVFYSVEAVEAYLNYDAKTIVKTRQRLLGLGGSSLKKVLGDNYIDNDDVKAVIKDNTESLITFELQPRITQRNDPYYTVFATVQRIVQVDNVTREIKKFSVRLDWGRLNNDVDYARRPHALVLLNINILNEGSSELNEQLNRIR